MTALIIVPPFLKYLAGPLAGPAYLAGSVDSGDVDVLDLNAHWLRMFAVGGDAIRGLIGDHARPIGGLAQAADAWRHEMRRVLPRPSVRPGIQDPLLSMCFTHPEVMRAATRLADRMAPTWMPLLPGERPDFVGVSLLWSGQVLAAAAIAQLVKRRYDGLPVVFGGAHITALQEVIASDPAFDGYADGYVAGYAEGTFADLVRARGDLDQVPGVFRAGTPTRRATPATVVPRFQSLEQYGTPSLSLPVQLSRGCAYGRCAFCTYPKIEGPYRTLDLDVLDTLVPLAHRHGASLAIKDALVVPERLDSIAARVGGLVPWSACTRLTPRLGRDRMTLLAEGGLRTLEVGVETLDPATLLAMGKRQKADHLHGLLSDVAGLPIHVILNVMSGFPGQDAAAAEDELRALTTELAHQHRAARFSTERNLLQVERGSALALRPEQYGITLFETWPWSSLYAWNSPSWTTSDTAWTGHHLETSP